MCFRKKSLLVFITFASTFALSCGQKSSTPNQLVSPPKEASSEMAPEILPEQTDNITILHDRLSQGLTVPLLVLTYSSPGNTDLKVIRKKIEEIDIHSAIDSSLDREREITDYPYTVNTFIVFVNTGEAYQKLLDCNSRYPAVKVAVVPFFKVSVRSYLTLTYSKPLIGERDPVTIWIGDSEPINFPDDPLSFNFEDPIKYVPSLSGCQSFNSDCFGSLLKNRYFQNPIVLNSEIKQPLTYLSSEITATLDLFSSGFFGEPSLSGAFLHSTYTKSVLKGLTLTQEIWIKGKTEPDSLVDALLKIEGAERHPTVFFNKKDEDYLFLLPINTSEHRISAAARTNPQKLGILYGEVRNQILTFLGLENL